MNIFEKLARRITRLSWNHTIHHIILEAMKRRIITSKQCHAILGAWNAECFPERGHASFLKAVEHTRAADGAYWCGKCHNWSKNNCAGNCVLCNTPRR